MKDRRLIINPVMCDVWTRTGKTARARGFVEITYTEDERLSLCGVVGPMSNGNCRGSAGQCTEAIRSGDPIASDGWTRAMVNRLCEIWDEWHLNDMHPYCIHQKGMGWREEAKLPLTKFSYILKRDIRKEKSEIERRSMAALKAGETVKLSSEDASLLSLPEFFDTYDEGWHDGRYEPFVSCLTHSSTETKTRGWVSVNEDPRGLLGKPCPICGHKYGRAWKKEKVPDEVINWLFQLPPTKVQPAWV